MLGEPYSAGRRSPAAACSSPILLLLVNSLSEGTDGYRCGVQISNICSFCQKEPFSGSIKHSLAELTGLNTGKGFAAHVGGGCWGFPSFPMEGNFPPRSSSLETFHLHLTFITPRGVVW